MSLSRMNIDTCSGICCCHVDPSCIPMTGIILTGSHNVNANGMGTARITDIVLGSCGHTGVLISGSSTVLINGLGSVSLNDSFSGCFTGSIISGSHNIN